MSDPQQQQPSESHCDFATPTSAGRRTNRQRTSKDAAYAWRLVNSTEVGQRCRKKNRMSGSCSPGDGRQNCSDSNGAGPRLSAPSGTKKRKRGRQPGWSCSACTLLNSNRRRKCEACQNQRDSNDDQQQLVTDKAALNAVANANDTNLSLPPPRSQSRSRRSSSSSGGSVTDWLRRRKIKSGKESRSFSGCQSSVQTATSIVADFSNNRHFTPKQSVKVRVCYGNHLLSSDSGPLIADIPCMVWARVSTGFVKSTVEDEAKQKREKENAFEMLVGPTELKAALQLSGQVCDTNEEDPASDDNIFRAQTLSDSLSPDGAQDQNQEHNPPVKIGEGVESITRCGRTDFARTPLNNILVEEDDKNLMESETATSSLPIYSFVQNTDNNLGRCNREKGSEAAIDDVSFDGKTAIHLNHKQHTREAISIACKPLIDLTSSSPVLYSQQFTASVSQNCQTLTPGVESFEYSLTQQNFDYRDTSEQQLQNQENMVLPDPIFVHGDAHNPSTHSSPPLSSSVAMTKPPPSLSLASGQGGFRSTFATAGKGAAISVSEEAMDKARKLLGDQSEARSAPPSSAPPPPSLSLASGQGGFRSTFATAGKGAAISVSEEAMDKAQKIFGQQSSSALLSQKALSIDKDVIEYMDERSGVSTIPLMRKKALVFDDTCTPFIRRRSMGRVSFGEATNGMLAEHLHPTETPLPGKSKRPRHFSTNKVLFGKDPFELSESSISAYSGVSNTSVRSKVMSTFTPKNSSRVVKGTALVTRSTTIKNPYARKQLDVSSHGAVTPVPFNFIGGTFAVRKFSPRSLAKAERILQKPNRNSHPEPGRSATVPPRSILYAQQSLWSDKKEIAHFQFSPSSDERISLRELDTRIGPMVRSASECVELGLSADLLEVNSTNAAKIRFYEGSGLPCNVLGDASYGVSKLVGSVKDVRQKLVNLGCNDSLLTDRWILNHLGWINWKLASTERRFPGVLGGKYLNYEHVIGQLQRRFKKEIRDTKRPAVRLVLNRDVPSSRLMILCVSQIKKSRVPRAGIELAVGAEGDRAASSHKKEFCLELTDGWYPIPAVMDEHLQTFVKEDKIKVGSKLLISSAELVGAEDGIDPLDDSYYTSRPNFSVALKLVANATRLAKWDAKLGFVRPTPTVQSCDGLLLVRSLAGVIPGGGNIPLIDFVISRRFPVMYLEKRNGTASVILTKAQEERHQREFDEKRDREVEKIAEGLEKECTKLVDEHAPEKWKEMISSTSMCDYYEGLSAQDRASVDAWKDKRSSMIRDKTNQAVDSRIQSNESMNRKSIPFCRFSVLSFLKQRLPVDTESDDDEGVVLVCKQAIATLTVWRMSEDQCNLLKEGSVVRMKHLSVLDGFRNGQLQLSANDKTKMQSCPTQTSSSQIKLSGYTKRFYTSIVRIHALSRKAATSRNRIGVDFVGCLVRLNIDEKGIAPLVSAYFTDESGLLLRLQRQGEGIGDSNILAWGKKLVEGKALSFRDVDILPYDFSANCAVAAWSLVTVEEKVAKTTCRKRALQKGENSIHTSSMASFDAMLPLHSRLSGNAEIAVGYILSLRIDCDARGARGKETGSKCHLIDIDCSGAAGVITATCPQSVLFQTLQLHLADCSRHGEAMANTQNYLQGKINHGANHDETASLETLFVESGILFQVTLRRESCHAIGECELRVVQMAPANTDALASLYWESLTAHNM